MYVREDGTVLTSFEQEMFLSDFEVFLAEEWQNVMLDSTDTFSTRNDTLTTNTAASSSASVSLSVRRVNNGLTSITLWNMSTNMVIRLGGYCWLGQGNPAFIVGHITFTENQVIIQPSGRRELFVTTSRVWDSGRVRINRFNGGPTYVGWMLR